MQPEITRLLQDWKGGDVQVSETLISAVYERLRQLASRQFASERSGHTLQPTALVHEAFLGLQKAEVDWQDRHHFYALAAQMMRRLLVDYARTRARQKRGGGHIHVDIDLVDAQTPAPSIDLLALDEALIRLAEVSERTARALELTYFAGMTQDDIAETLSVSRRTVDRDLKLGRAWLRAELEVP